MQRRHRQLGFAFALLSGAYLGICLGSTSAVAWSDTHAARVRAVLSSFLDPASSSDKARPPALSIAIGVSGHVVMAEGFGEAAPGFPASANTRYRVGSLTKQLTAAAVLRLIELRAVAPLSGRPIALDTKVSDILEGVESWTQPDQAPITLRSLLTMTSNLPNYTRQPPPELDPWGAISAPQLLGAVKKLRPEGWPSSFEYSNTSYFILAAVIDAVRLPMTSSVLGYPDALRRLVLEPAGMDETTLVSDRRNTSIVAVPHFRRKPAFNAPDWLRGSGDVVSTVRDIVRWNGALISGRIINEPELSAMFSESARVTPTDYYGMGWYVTDKDGWKFYSHSGSVPGYTAFNAICQDYGRKTWTSVTLLTNMDGVEDIEDLADRIVRIALED